jgi:hypothetical protein
MYSYRKSNTDRDSVVALSDVQLLFTVQKAEPQLATANGGIVTTHATTINTLDAFIFISRYFVSTHPYDAAGKHTNIATALSLVR